MAATPALMAATAAVWGEAVGLAAGKRSRAGG